MDLRDHNREAWNRCVAAGNRWTRPVGPEAVRRARDGVLEVVLTPRKPVPAAWFPPLEGLRVLGLAAAGGQQGPLFAAAGARVTVLDNAPAQLARDLEVAEREGLAIETVEGDMRDLSAFPDASFDLVFHPCSNGFVEDVLPVWREAFRVLEPGGVLLSGLSHPVPFLFDWQLRKEGVFQLRYPMPYSDLASLAKEDLQELLDAGEPLIVAHPLEDLIGGQIAAGFVITGFYEDDDADEEGTAAWFKGQFATRAVKPPLRP